MHFDSDDEGIPLNPAGSRDGSSRFIRHPICSAVVFVTGGIGGPTLVTDQRDDAKRLARNGWLVAPVAGRVAVFDGECLHGVVPGRGVAATPPGVKNTDGREERTRRAAHPERFRDDGTEEGHVDDRVLEKRRDSRYGDARRAGAGRERVGRSREAQRVRFPTHVRSWRTIPRCRRSASRGRAPSTSTKRFSRRREKETEGSVAAAEEVPAAPAAAVWEDVDAERNASCFPSLSVNALRSLPAYDACFMF